jgi:hypothetical protein
MQNLRTSDKPRGSEFIREGVGTFNIFMAEKPIRE